MARGRRYPGRISNPDLSRITNVQWAYAAGIIDGEGCISGMHNKINDVYTVRVSVGQMDKRLTEWLIELTEIGKCRCRNNGRGGGLHLWTVIRMGEVEEFLKGCLPYLVLKGRQAEIALELIAKPRPNKLKQDQLFQMLRKAKTIDG